MKYHHFAELFALLVAALTLRKWWPLHFKLLAVLALVTFCVEIGAQNYYDTTKKSNYFFYNTFLPVQYGVFQYTLYRLISDSVLKRMQVYLAVAAVAGTAITYALMEKGFGAFNSQASTLYLVLLIIGAGCFYIDAMKNDIALPLTKQPGFWIATGLLFFSVILVMRFIFWDFVQTIPGYTTILRVTNILANTLLYGGFIGTFICLYKTKSYLLPSPLVR
jgi:hypothetical protein